MPASRQKWTLPGKPVAQTGFLKNIKKASQIYH